MASYLSDDDALSDKDDEFQVDSSASISSDSDTLTDDDELDGTESPNMPKRRRRGRPIGSKRPAPHSDEDEDNELGHKVRRGSRLHPLHMVLAAMCCTAICVGSFSEADLAALRENYQSMDKTEKRQWLLDYFWSHSQLDDESQTWNFLFVLGTKEVCTTAFREILGIPSSTFYEVRKLFLSKYYNI
ncbi:uncharacterized protein LOC128174614 [Crassostrea angulata]|uniref:uncharacterized protein LOC128174614 n=1 Tax=Magallana angulata TaxID=2784310 RepID=UPI0022B0D0C4|nr:uncharacterized protein LOC128174614 [Crassostrea angulata]